MDEKKLTDRQYMETQTYLDKKEELNREINTYNVLDVDRSVFQKDKKEKAKTLDMKWQNLAERQHHYGIGNTNKHLNIPSRQLSEPIHLTF